MVDQELPVGRNKILVFNITTALGGVLEPIGKLGGVMMTALVPRTVPRNSSVRRSMTIGTLSSLQISTSVSTSDWTVGMSVVSGLEAMNSSCRGTSFKNFWAASSALGSWVSPNSSLTLMVLIHAFNASVWSG